MDNIPPEELNSLFAHLFIKVRKLNGEEFDEYQKFGETHRPKTWRTVFFIYLLQHDVFLPFSTRWFWIDFFIAWQWKRSILGLHCHAIKNKSHNHSITLLKKLGYDRWLIYEQPRQDLGLCGFLFARYSEKCFTQIYKALYGDAMLVPFWGAPTWRPYNNRNICHLSFCYWNENLLVQSSVTLKVAILSVHELFR